MKAPNGKTALASSGSRSTGAAIVGRPQSRSPRLAKVLTWLGLANGLVALILLFLVFFPQALTGTDAANNGVGTSGIVRPWPLALLFYFSFLTQLSNIGLVLTYAADLTSWRWLGWFRKPRTQAQFVSLIFLVGAFFNIVLAPLVDFEGSFGVANVMLHTIAPLLYFAWWWLRAGMHPLRWIDALWMLVPLTIYGVYMMVRGAILDDWPYEAFDADAVGWPSAIVSLIATLVGTGLVALIVVLINNVARTRSQAQQH